MSVFNMCFLTFSFSKGDNGQKGPEGAPGKDGARVRTKYISPITYLLKKKKNFLFHHFSPTHVLPVLSVFSGFDWSHRSSWTIWTQRSQGRKNSVTGTVWMFLIIKFNFNIFCYFPCTLTDCFSLSRERLDLVDQVAPLVSVVLL